MFTRNCSFLNVNVICAVALITSACSLADTGSDLQSQKSLAFSCLASGKMDDAQNVYNNIIQNYSKDPCVAETVYNIGFQCIRTRAYGLARQANQFVVDNYPQSDYAILAQMGVVLSNISLGNDDIAQACVDKLLSTYNQNALISDMAYQIADHYRAYGKYTKAMTLYQYAATKNPAAEIAVWAYMGQALTAIATSDDASCDAVTLKLRSDFKSNSATPEILCQIANGYRASSKCDKARPLYQYILDNMAADKNAMWAQAGITICDLLAKNSVATPNDISLLLTKYNGNSEITSAVYEVAENCRTLMDFKDANNLYTFIVNNNPDENLAMWANKGLAIASISLGNDDVAKASVAKLLGQYANNASITEAMYHVAHHFRSLKKDKDAIPLYKIIIQKSPPGSDMALSATQGKTLSDIALRDFDSAKIDSNDLLTKFATSDSKAEAVFQIAEMYRMYDRLDDANQFYNAYLKEWPSGLYCSQINIAVAAIKVLTTNDISAARVAADQFRSDFAQNPYLTKTYFWIIESWAYGAYCSTHSADQNSLLTLAAALIDKADPNSNLSSKAAANYLLGQGYMRANKFREASRAFAQSYQADPNFEYADCCLAMSGYSYEKLFDMGRISKSEAVQIITPIYMKFISRFPTSVSFAHVQKWLQENAINN
jgi:tetratricopeptide (TPR) repeat protein